LCSSNALDSSHQVILKSTYTAKNYERQRHKKLRIKTPKSKSTSNLIVRNSASYIPKFHHRPDIANQRGSERHAKPQTRNKPKAGSASNALIGWQARRCSTALFILVLALALRSLVSLHDDPNLRIGNDEPCCWRMRYAVPWSCTPRAQTSMRFGGGDLLGHFRCAE
jgi:hypothetical protein